MTLKLVRALSLFAVAALAPTLANAEVREHKFRLGIQTNLNTAQGAGTQKFADLVSEKSGGKMKVQVFPGGSLGGDLQTVSALRGGTIDATVLATSTLVGTVKEYILFDLPFLFNNDAEAMAVVDGPLGKRLNTALNDKALVGLANWGAGYRNLTNSRRPVTKLEDIKGLKIRVLQNPIYVDLWNALGANAVPMPFPEVYTALEQKTVDGQENPSATIVSSKLFEVQKYYTHTKHIYFISTLLFSKPVWEKLNDDERKIILDAAADAQANWRKTVVEEDGKFNTELAQKMEAKEIAPAEMTRLREAARSTIEKHSAAADQAAVKELFSTIEKVRGTN